MGKIQELDATLINKIAAGEVIESAQSVVKELVENSLDANAKKISIEASHGGLSRISIADNGQGFEEDDLEISLKRHTTSKIKSFHDLENLHSYGFRGEALSSIASVSRLTIISGQSESAPAIKMESEQGKITDVKNIQGRKGTYIEVKDLFYNTPVRRKFLKSERAEDKKIKDRVNVLALSRPEIEFDFFLNEKKIYNLKPAALEIRITDIFGENIGNHLLEVKLERRGIKCSGFISDPEFYRSNRLGQFFFINNRPIEIKNSAYLLKKSYDELLPHGAHPWCFLFFEIDPRYIDVNVHPTKKEIRFLDEEGFHSFFLEAVNNVLRSKTPVTFLEMKKRLSSPSPGRNNFIPPERTSFQSILHDELFKNPSSIKGFSVENVGAGSNLGELTNNQKTVHREFIPKKHFGILFETFILAEAEDGLYIIDQHTAHERIRYEEILNSLKRTGYVSQPLLSPIRIDLSIQEAEEIIERKSEYEKVGIFLDSLGDGTILIREAPVFIEPGTEKEVILDFLNRTGNHSDERELYDLMAKCVACRSAIKKGDQVSDHILGELLNRLSYCENPSRCPHGRPTLIKLSRNDLEKMFHRK
jgi:DNA mismatch repair protein MutL